MKALALSLLLSTVLVAQSSAPAAGAEPVAKEHPGVVALSQDGTGNWVYRSFPQLTRLYTSQNDRRGASNCDEQCVTAWPPLVATGERTGEKVGQWTVIQRSDGQPQWAYKGKPVYLRYHDMPVDPSVTKEGFSPLQP